ncbi:unnamed protein product, partial [Meganyctiphanes norvegica]
QNRSSYLNESRQGHRRMMSPRPESWNDDSRPSSRSKPVPPKKPERLSLHHTTSMQSFEESVSSLSRASSSNHIQGNVLQTWPSDDNDLSQSRVAPEYLNYHGNGDGGVTMVLNEDPLSQTLIPQGTHSPNETKNWTSVQDSRSLMHRSQSPDSALHLDGDQSYDSSQEIYGYTGYSYSNSKYHSYQERRQSQPNVHCKYGMSNLNKAHCNSASLSVASVSQRPHEQWY